MDGPDGWRSFGTAIEGYIGSRIEQVYGNVRGYLIPPETTNDDVVYELLLLDVYEKMGKGITSDVLGDEWVKKLPYGVSAEGTALRNLNLGIYPPELALSSIHTVIGLVHRCAAWSAVCWRPAIRWKLPGWLISTR